MTWYKRAEPSVSLPISDQEFADFVKAVIIQGDLPDTDDTAESIATLILHMPQSVSSAPLSFFSNSVNKSRANAIAYAKMQEYSQKRKSAQAAATASNQVEPQQSQASTDDQPIQDRTVQSASERVE